MLTRFEEQALQSQIKANWEIAQFTLRDKFASAAMQTMLETQNNKMAYEDIAELAYYMADAMIKTRNKKDKEKDEANKCELLYGPKLLKVFA